VSAAEIAGGELEPDERAELDRLSAVARLSIWSGGLDALATGEWPSAEAALRVDSFAAFTSRFGTGLEGTFLTDAVRGFYLNGGAVCYVLRLDPGLDAFTAFATALGTVNRLDEVDLIGAPDPMLPPQSDDVVLSLQRRLVEFCELDHRRLALLDGRPGASSDDVIGQGRTLRGTNAALYYPWLRPTISTSGASFVPPCGHAAGAIASTDASVGAHRAPANVALAGVLDVDVDVTSAEQGLINDAGINVIRAFPGRGIRIWGARTLSEDPAWTYLPVRRVFQTAARWCESAFESPVFEPSDQALWRRIRIQLTEYFTQLFQQGALLGNSPAEAFYVHCDETTNTSETRDQGRVVTEIGLAPASPNEFIIVRITRDANGVAIVGPTSG
jgi:hypothetical protein